MDEYFNKERPWFSSAWNMWALEIFFLIASYMNWWCQNIEIRKGVFIHLIKSHIKININCAKVEKKKTQKYESVKSFPSEIFLEERKENVPGGEISKESSLRQSRKKTKNNFAVKGFHIRWGKFFPNTLYVESISRWVHIFPYTMKFSKLNTIDPVLVPPTKKKTTFLRYIKYMYKVEHGQRLSPINISTLFAGN